MDEKKDLDGSRQYIIVFQGHLDERRAGWFGGMAMAQRPNGETVLSGSLTDQAALHGVLSRLRDLGLPLLYLRRGDFHRQEKNGLDHLIKGLGWLCEPA